MHALVFAAGRGTRLRPYTDRTPKPLLEIAGEPMLVRTLRSVVDAGVDEIVIVVGYRATDVIDTVGTSIDGVPIGYASQDVRQGLAHAVCTAFEDGYELASPGEIDRSNDGSTDVVTVNGDNVFDSDCDLSKLVDRHREPDVDGTLLLDRVARNEAETTARCVLAEDGTVRSLESSIGEPEPGYIAGGVQTHDARTLFEACRAVERGDSGEYELADALERLIADGRRYVGVELEGWHLNVNTPADLERARRYFGADDSTR
ncbi:nucleotidyltransferase family protein [Natronorubrum sp. FCH18a]|uniref:nucleotidyltransferase family protein n=1 Tax=Natronorubrum sp. FCH18a TaxID=3447018 RepID=UPI003F514763